MGIVKLISCIIFVISVTETHAQQFEFIAEQNNKSKEIKNYNFKGTSAIVHVPVPYYVEEALNYIYDDDWTFKIIEIKKTDEQLNFDDLNEETIEKDKDLIQLYFMELKNEGWGTFNLSETEEKSSFQNFQKTQVLNFPAIIFNYKSKEENESFVYIKTDYSYLLCHYSQSIKDEVHAPKLSDFLSTLHYNINNSIVSREGKSFTFTKIDSLYSIFLNEYNSIIYSSDENSNKKIIIIKEEDRKDRTIITVLNDVMNDLDFKLESAKMSKVRQTGVLNSVQRIVYGKHEGKEASLFQKIIQLNEYSVAVYLGLTYDKSEDILKEFELISDSFIVK